MKKFFSLCALLMLFCLATAKADEKQNHFIVTDHGLEMYQWDLDFLRQAKYSIEISGAFLGGTVAREMLGIIGERLAVCPDLQVYILCATILLEPEDWAMINVLKKEYPRNFHIEIPVSVPRVWPDVTAIDNHLKMVIVDETYFSTGGTNLDQNQATEGTWAPPRNPNKVPVVGDNLPAAMRDQDFVCRGPMAKQMREIFHKHFALWEHYNKTGIFETNPEKFKDKSHYKPVKEHAYLPRFENSDRKRTLDTEKTKIVLSGPHESTNPITKEYIRLINSAKEELVIANLYLAPVDELLNALMNAVNRGVKLTVITNGIHEEAPEYSRFFAWANRIHYVPLFYGKTFHFWDAWSVAGKPVKNTRIFEYHVRDVLLHKKIMIVDNKVAVMGSYNFGHRSHIGDFEMVHVFDSAEIGADILRNYTLDLSNSREITPAEARSWYFDPVIASLGEMQKRFHGLM